MSQNKTVIPGFEPADNSNNNVNSSFYSRNGSVRQTGKGTVVSGMTDNPAHAQRVTNAGQFSPVKGMPLVSDKPIVGFLYSVSKTAAGEFWPLQIGQNHIGKSPDCDVILSEGTVSSDHATLVIRKMKNPEKVIASICDAQSTNGTMLNGESLGFTAVECKSGDIITIGDHYELALILVDASSFGLSVSEEFLTVDEPAAKSAQPGGAANSPYGRSQRPKDGTVGFEPEGSGNNGGTIAM